MVALVTGGQGFIGRHVRAELERRGWRVVLAGRPAIEIPSRAYDELVEASQPSLLVHCAGPASVQDAERSPAADRRASVDVLRAVIDSAPPAARLVLLSSAAVYGNPGVLPVRESTPVAPISAYGRNRVESEELAQRSGMPLLVARVFSAYGEGLRRQVLWDIAQQALTAQRVELMGTGQESRDFVHATDVATAVATLAETSLFEGEVVNVASGDETRIADLAAMLVSELNPKAEIRFTGERRRADPLRWLADVSTLRNRGWEPLVRIEPGARRYAQWVGSQREDRA